MNKISKEIKDVLLEENKNIKIDKDILYYGEARQRERHHDENIEVIELMFSHEHTFNITQNEVTQNHLNKLGLISYSIAFSNNLGNFSIILNENMEEILQQQGI